MSSNLFPTAVADLPPPARSVAVTSIITVIIALLAVGLRFISRGVMLGRLGREDWFIAAAIVLSAGNTMCMNLQAQHGIGVPAVDLPPEQAKLFLKSLFYTIIFYNFSLTATKISILLLFQRVFQLALRKTISVTIAGVVVYSLWLFFSGLFFCIPVEAFWDADIVGAHCISKDKWFVDSGLNIATDIIIFVLPLSVLRRLRLPRRQKAGLYVVFTLGFFVCIVSIIRLYSLYIAARAKEPSKDHVGIALWSCVELNTSIVCACLLTLKPLMIKLFPQLFATQDERGYHEQSNPPTISSARSGPKPRMLTTTESLTGVFEAVELGDLEDGRGTTRAKGDMDMHVATNVEQGGQRDTSRIILVDTSIG